jgi:hypothetical protein
MRIGGSILGRPTEEIYGHPLEVGEETIQEATDDPQQIQRVEASVENVYFGKYFFKKLPRDTRKSARIFEMTKSRNPIWGDVLSCRESTPTDCVLAIRGGLYIILKRPTYSQQYGPVDKNNDPIPRHKDGRGTNFLAPAPIGGCGADF